MNAKTFFCCLLFVVAKIHAQDSLTCKALAQQLFRIDEEDQRYRQQLDETVKKYGGDSPELKALLTSMSIADSLNTLQVANILDTYGWLSAAMVGSEGNTTLFMVIQHAGLATQKKYLPLMEEAVKNGKASARELALLEDRVALKEGKKQVYGSQVYWNMKTGERYVLPLEDPDRVDERRAAIGLGKLADYLKECEVNWDVNQYKKDLPAIEAKYKQAIRK